MKQAVPNSDLTQWPLSDQLSGLDRLVSTEGGLIHSVQRVSDANAAFPVYTAGFGSLSALHPGYGFDAERVGGLELTGSGGSTSPRLARAIAIVEAVERYSSCVPARDLIWASYDELKTEAMDMDAVPVCSERELLDPGCPVRNYDTSERIRWTRAWSFAEARRVWVPAVMVWLQLEALTPSERFTIPISTGCAAFTSLEKALVNGICEVVERDAIALVWLQKLALPRINFDDAPASVLKALAVASASNRSFDFFDATTDIGVPTIYCVDTDPANDAVRHVVMCAPELDPALAVVKILREIASSRIALESSSPSREDVDEFRTILDGALYMGSVEREDAFDFILSKRQRRETILCIDVGRARGCPFPAGLAIETSGRERLQCERGGHRDGRSAIGRSVGRQGHHSATHAAFIRASSQISRPSASVFGASRDGIPISRRVRHQRFSATVCLGGSCIQSVSYRSAGSAGKFAKRFRRSLRRRW